MSPKEIHPCTFFDRGDAADLDENIKDFRPKAERLIDTPAAAVAKSVMSDGPESLVAPASVSPDMSGPADAPGASASVTVVPSEQAQAVAPGAGAPAPD